MIIKSTPILKRTQKAYELYKQTLERELDECYNIPNNTDMEVAISKINDEITESNIMMDAIDAALK